MDTVHVIMDFIKSNGGRKSESEIVQAVYDDLESAQVREPDDDCAEFTEWALEMAKLDGLLRCVSCPSDVNPEWEIVPGQFVIVDAFNRPISEGPFDTQTEAQNFLDAEVGIPDCAVVRVN
jgi:hypothetical protein